MGKQLEKWRKLYFCLFSVLLCLLLPIQVFAVEYEITNVEINAYLQTNGNVLVEEQHTYSFVGEFNGIIRELIPKEGTNIINLQAFEGNKELRIETIDYEHRIHRAGKDEQITVDLVYEIENGVDVYRDVAEFYWPFFDNRNVSDYQDLIINVFPPSETDDVIAFGYDEAFLKENILEDGVVQFLFGYVFSNHNGDIRVVYDSQLFPEAPMTKDVNKKQSIEKELQQLLAEEQMRVETEQALNKIGSIVNSICFIFLICLFLWTYIQAQLRKRQILQQVPSGHIIPEQQLSMPGIVYFIKRRITPELISVALLDLVRKGNVKRYGNQKFIIISRTDLLEHEELLVEWLFDEIGKGKELFLSKIKNYTKNSVNHAKYNSYKEDWKNLLQQELNEANLIKSNRILRIFFVLISIVLFLLSILFFLADVFDPFLSTFSLSIIFFIVAIYYKPKTWEGHKIFFEWKYFKKQFFKINEEDWKNLTEDDKMRGFLFGLGTKDKSLQEKNKSLVSAFPRPVNRSQLKDYIYVDDSWLNFAINVAKNFHYANDNMYNSSGSSSSSSDSSDSGVGGGGGGSGAF